VLIFYNVNVIKILSNSFGKSYKGRVNNKQASKLLLHTVYPLLPASGDTGQGYAEVRVLQTSRMHFNKIDTGLL
jgi:hypothetical protein